MKYDSSASVREESRTYADIYSYFYIFCSFLQSRNWTKELPTSKRMISSLSWLIALIKFDMQMSLSLWVIVLSMDKGFSYMNTALAELCRMLCILMMNSRKTSHGIPASGWRSVLQEHWSKFQGTLQFDKIFVLTSVLSRFEFKE